MNKITKINKTYIIAAILSNHFFVTKYLLYNLYTYATHFSFLYIIGIILVIILLAPVLYRYMHKNTSKTISPLSKNLLYVYLIISSILSIVTIGNFVSIHWLRLSNQTLIIGAMMLTLIFTAFIDTKSLYKAFSILILMIISILSIYLLSKSSYLNIENMTLSLSFKSLTFNTLLYSIFIILETFFIFFIPTVDEVPLSKKHYSFYIFFMIAVILFESIVELNEFNGIIEYITYPFFESFNTIYFGQYIGYLNFPVLFIYMIGCFSKIALNLKVVQTTIQHKSYTYLYLLLCFAVPISLLKNAEDYAILRPYLVIPALLSLLFAMLFYHYGGKKNGRNSITASTLSKKR